MYHHIDIANPQDLAIWCCILVGLFGLLSKKNICPEDANDLDPVKFGLRDLTIPLIRSHSKALDPVFHLGLLFKRTQAPPDRPAFSYKTTSENLAFISHKMFKQRWKKLLSQSGFSPEKFSGHSLRRGGATYLYQCGASTLEIQASGD